MLVTIFICYARKDEALLNELKTHLQPLQREGLIDVWYDRDISVGTEWEREITQQINTAQIVLLLISPDFMNSDYVYSIEMKRALERHERGEARVIPIILRPVFWQGKPLGKLQALPTDGRPVTSSYWYNRDDALYDITQGIYKVVQSFVETRNSSQISPSYSPTIYQLYDVFVKSGVPGVTFVEREDFGRLKLSLAQPGRGVIIEGPSGVGKTTSLKKAVEELRSSSYSPGRRSGIGSSLRMLSARNPEHRDLLENLSSWHNGTVVIDDFHRLDPPLCKKVIDYLKYLADTELESKKLVVVGIPQSGQTIVDLSFDLATRIDVFKCGKVKDDLILRMIEQGEQALNITFGRKNEIVSNARGSLNVAQFLCFNICQREAIIQTQEHYRTLQSNINAAILDVIADLARKFGESIIRFATMGGDQDITCVRLLEELARSDEGFLSLPVLKHRKPDLVYGIERFIHERWMEQLYQGYPECKNHLFFDQNVQALVVDDPQLTFYLSKLSIAALMKDVGKTRALSPKKIFVSYSHKDTQWLERLRVHLTPLEHGGMIDLWDDTKIEAGAKWKEEIQAAIESCAAAVILVSADFLASKFISRYELPKLLLQAESQGTIILPLIVSHCLLTASELHTFQAVNSPDQPLIEMSLPDCERTLVKLAEAISERLAKDKP